MLAHVPRKPDCKGRQFVHDRTVPFFSLELRVIPPLIFIGVEGQKRRTDEKGGEGKTYLCRPDCKFDGDVLFHRQILLWLHSSEILPYMTRE